MINKKISIIVISILLFSIMMSSLATAGSIRTDLYTSVKLITNDGNDNIDGMEATVTNIDLNADSKKITRLIPEDALFSAQWGLDQASDYDIDAPEGWGLLGGYGSRDIVIAILDSGVDYNHPDIASNIWINENEIPNNGIDDDGNGFIDDVRGWNFFGNNNDPMDKFGHGTLCAGLAAAKSNNGFGIAGVAGNCKIMCVKIGGIRLPAENIAPGIRYAVKNGADIISMSFGSRDTKLFNISWNNYEKQTKYAIDEAYENNTVLVACAGNQNDNQESFPAAWDNVIGVAGINRYGKLGGNSLYGSNYGDWVDVAAPGWGVMSLKAEGTLMGIPYAEDYCISSGTSFAAPQVAGLAALLLSQEPELTNEAVRERINEGAEPIDGVICRSGLINIYNTLNLGSNSQSKVLTSK